MIVATKSVGLNRKMNLLWLLFWLLMSHGAMATEPMMQQQEYGNYAVEAQCSPLRDENDLSFGGYSPRRTVLSINAANGYVNWERITAVFGNDEWQVRELQLDGFGHIMNEQSFHAALEHSYPVLESTIKGMKPDAILVSSKGIGVLAYLAAKGIWIERPAILLSPIPNPIDGLVDGTSYQSEWNDTVQILRNKIGEKHALIVAVGSSSDEEMLITEAMQDTSCGTISPSTSNFENCTNWRHVVITGNGNDHGWKNLQKNEWIIAKLIDYIFYMQDRLEGMADDTI